MDANIRGLENGMGQVDQLEQNLEVNVPTQPTPLPSPATPQPPTPQPVCAVPGVPADPGLPPSTL
eukprot:6212178-Prorocentrum_lima.AAC.1